MPDSETYRVRRDAGLCPNCKAEPEPGRVYCKRCLIRHREIAHARLPYRAELQRQRRADRIARGVCIYCAQEPPENGTQSCGECRHKQIARREGPRCACGIRHGGEPCDLRIDHFAAARKEAA